LSPFDHVRLLERIIQFDAPSFEKLGFRFRSLAVLGIEQDFIRIRESTVAGGANEPIGAKHQRHVEVALGIVRRGFDEILGFPTQSTQINAIKSLRCS